MFKRLGKRIEPCLSFRWILHGLDLYRKMKEEDPGPLEECSPSEIRRLLFRVLKESRALQLAYRALSKRELAGIEGRPSSSSSQPPLTIFQVRQINGCMNRVPDHFYPDVWHILQRTPGGIRLGKHLLPQEPTLTQRTRYERDQDPIARSVRSPPLRSCLDRIANERGVRFPVESDPRAQAERIIAS